MRLQNGMEVIIGVIVLKSYQLITESDLPLHLGPYIFCSVFNTEVERCDSILGAMCRNAFGDLKK